MWLLHTIYEGPAADGFSIPSEGNDAKGQSKRDMLACRKPLEKH
ncbi:MAG: hypothetical protein ACRD19_17680 [Terriglobia bacterium]